MAVPGGRPNPRSEATESPASRSASRNGGGTTGFSRTPSLSVAPAARSMCLVPGPAERPSPSAVVKACLRAHRARDWEELRKLFHADARIGVFSSGGRPGDPEKALEDMKRSYEEDDVYDAYIADMSELDDEAVVLHGRVRSSRAGGFMDVERVWLYVVRERRLYRSAVFRTEAEALAAYAERGPTLGV